MSGVGDADSSSGGKTSAPASTASSTTSSPQSNAATITSSSSSSSPSTNAAPQSLFKRLSGTFSARLIRQSHDAEAAAAAAASSAGGTNSSSSHSPTMNAIARARAARARATSGASGEHHTVLAISGPTGFQHIAGVDTRSGSDTIYAALHKASDRLLTASPSAAAAANVSPATPLSSSTDSPDSIAAALAAAEEKASKSRRRKSHAVDADQVAAAIAGGADPKSRRRRHRTNKAAGKTHREDDATDGSYSDEASGAPRRVASPGAVSPPTTPLPASASSSAAAGAGTASASASPAGAAAAASPAATATAVNKPPVPKSKPPVPTSRPPDRLTSRPTSDGAPVTAAPSDQPALTRSPTHAAGQPSTTESAVIAPVVAVVAPSTADATAAAATVSATPVAVVAAAASASVSGPTTQESRESMSNGDDDDDDDDDEELDTTPKPSASEPSQSLASDRSDVQTRPRRSSTDAGDAMLSESSEQDRAAELALRSRASGRSTPSSGASLPPASLAATAATAAGLVGAGTTAPAAATQPVAPPVSSTSPTASGVGATAAILQDGKILASDESEGTSTSASGSPVPTAHLSAAAPTVPKTTRPHRGVLDSLARSGDSPLHASGGADDTAWKESEASEKSEATARTSASARTAAGVPQPSQTPPAENPYGNVRAAIEAAERAGLGANLSSSATLTSSLLTELTMMQRGNSAAAQPVAVVRSAPPAAEAVVDKSRVPRASVLLTELDRLAVLDQVDGEGDNQRRGSASGDQRRGSASSTTKGDDHRSSVSGSGKTDGADTSDDAAAANGANVEGAVERGLKESAVRCAFPGCLAAFDNVAQLASHVAKDHAPARQSAPARSVAHTSSAAPAVAVEPAATTSEPATPSVAQATIRSSTGKPKNSPGLMARFTRQKKQETIEISEPTFSQEGTDRVKEEFRAKLEPLRQTVHKPAPATPPATNATGATATSTPVAPGSPSSGPRTLKRGEFSLGILQDTTASTAATPTQPVVEPATTAAPTATAPAAPSTATAATTAPAVTAPKPAPPAGAPTAPAAGHTCKASGCDLVFDTADALAQHARSAHGKVEISASDLMLRRASGSSPQLSRNRPPGGPAAGSPVRSVSVRAPGRSPTMGGTPGRRGSPQQSPHASPTLIARAHNSPDSPQSPPTPGGAASRTQFRTLPRSFRPDGMFRAPAIRSPPPAPTMSGPPPPVPPAIATDEPRSRLSVKLSNLPIARLVEKAAARPALSAAQFHQYYLYPMQYHVDYRPPEADLVPPMANDARAKLAPDAEYKAIVMKRAAMQLIQGHPWTERLRATPRANASGATTTSATTTAGDDTADNAGTAPSALDDFVSIDLAQVRQWPHLRGEVRAESEPLSARGSFKLLSEADIVHDSDDDSLTNSGSATSMASRASKRRSTLSDANEVVMVEHIDTTDDDDDTDGSEVKGNDDNDGDDDDDDDDEIDGDGADKNGDDGEESGAVDDQSEATTERLAEHRRSDAAVTAAAAAAVAAAPRETTSEKAAMTLQETLNMLAALSKTKKPAEPWSESPPAAPASQPVAVATSSSSSQTSSAATTANSTPTATAAPVSMSSLATASGVAAPLANALMRPFRRESSETSLNESPSSSRWSLLASSVTSESSSFEIMLNSDRQAAMEAAQSKMRGLSEREKVVTELIDTERTYLDQLSQLIEVYEKPLHQTDMVNQYAHKRIFTNTVALHQVVADLVKAIDECEAAGTHFTMIGRTYDRLVTVNFGKLYAVNITQSERAAETLSQLLKSNKQLRDFQAECRRGGRRPLEELLLAPFQRACRLPLLFKELLKHTAADDADHAACEAVLSKLNSINTEINDFKRDQDELVKTRLIEDAIDGPNKLLPSSSRRLVRQATCSCVHSSGKELGELHLMLFTDVLYACKRSTSRDREVFKLKIVVRLVQFAKVREARVKRHPYAFEVSVADGTAVATTLCAFDSLEQKILWMCDVEDCINKL